MKRARRRIDVNLEELDRVHDIKMSYTGRSSKTYVFG